MVHQNICIFCPIFFIKKKKKLYQGFLFLRFAVRLFSSFSFSVSWFGGKFRRVILQKSPTGNKNPEPEQEEEQDQMQKQEPIAGECKKKRSGHRKNIYMRVRGYIEYRCFFFKGECVSI